MKTFIKSITAFRLLGIILILTAIPGYIFVADELRHLGEFLGVTSILISGVILTLIDTKWKIFKKWSMQWISFGLLLGIPMGGIVFDNMPLGITTGLALGVFFAIAFNGNNRNANDIEHSKKTSR